MALVLILLMFFVAGLSNFLIYKFALDSQFNQLREKLMVVAQTAALLIDGDLLLQIPLTPDGINSPNYTIIAEKLKKIKEVNPPIKYVYAMVKTDKQGIWQFVADPESVTPEDKKRGITTYHGYNYDASRFPEMMKAFDGPAADKRLGIDEWGITLSGYAPIRDKNGNAVAMLGVDIMAEDVYNIQNKVHRRGIFVLMVGIIFSVSLGVLFSKTITHPIKNLVKGTRRIAVQDLQYRVEVKGPGEIRELARSFNKMAESLFEARSKMEDYFYHAIQSLVKILEAKDHYTRGHSERVAEYTEKIALRMGFPKGKVDIIKKVAQLHDIGKLSIQQTILNKTGKLTEEEWKIIQSHPIVGEDILKPIVFDQELLNLVRSHHERYDGKGYPDKLEGEEIDIFAQIVSVADAYDAMSSARAYRLAFNKEKVIEELQRNSGTQFNPKIVKVLLEILG